MRTLDRDARRPRRRLVFGQRTTSTSGSARSRHRGVGVLSVVALCLALAASAGTVNAGGHRHLRPAPHVGSITIGGVFCACHLDVYVAWKKGFLARYGVTVKEYVFTEGGSRTYAGVVDGAFDLGAATVETLVRGRAAGDQVKAIGNVYPEPWALSVRADERSAIRTVNDLLGRKVAVSKIGSGSWAFLVALLGKSGLAADDVNIVELGDLNGILSALKARRVDAAVLWEPGTSEAVRGRIATPIVNLLDPGTAARIFDSDMTMSQVLAVRSDLLDGEPELAAAIVAAIRDADAWLTERTRSPAQVAKVLKQVAPVSFSVGTLVAASKATLRVQPSSPTLSREGYDASTKLLLETGALSQTVPFEQLVDCRFAGCGP